ncbi:MAG: DsbA family protein [Bacteroidota bacterium]
MTEPYCDPVTGECTPAPLEGFNQEKAITKPEAEIIYVGDPMCSWCWGISPALKTLRDHYKTQNVSFNIVVGGLRPGGGDPWNDEMKAFLKHHWEEVNARSGQPFGYKLFDKEEFNYDTEPACRAMVAARPLLNGDELEFFSAIKKKFYVASEDPTQIEFYESICQAFNISFSEFTEKFESEAIKKATYDEFVMNRGWGISGYPTVLLKKGEQMYRVTYGYATFDIMKEQIDHILSLKEEEAR